MIDGSLGGTNMENEAERKLHLIGAHRTDLCVYVRGWVHVCVCVCVCVWDELYCWGNHILSWRRKTCSVLVWRHEKLDSQHHLPHIKESFDIVYYISIYTKTYLSLRISLKDGRIFLVSWKTPTFSNIFPRAKHIP